MTYFAGYVRFQILLWALRQAVRLLRWLITAAVLLAAALPAALGSRLTVRDLPPGAFL